MTNCYTYLNTYIKLCKHSAYKLFHAYTILFFCTSSYLLHQSSLVMTNVGLWPQMLMVKVRPDVALAFNYFVMIMERLCRVSHDNPMQEECTQLLVPVVWGWGGSGSRRQCQRRLVGCPLGGGSWPTNNLCHHMSPGLKKINKKCWRITWHGWHDWHRWHGWHHGICTITGHCRVDWCSYTYRK